MPDNSDDNTPAGGVDNFIDRLGEQLNAATGAADDDPNKGDDSKEVNKEDNKAGDDLDSLRSPDDSGDDSKPDPLDDLSGEAHKGSANNKDAEDDNKDGDDKKHADILSTFDPDDQDKIRSYIDEQVAAEVTATESAGGAFKRLKSENRELEGKVRDLESRTSDPDALKAATARVEELETQLRVNEEKNSAIRLEDTQAYRDAVTNPQHEILNASDSIADRYGADKDKLANILGNPNRRELSDQLNKLLGDDVADADKFELYELSRKAEDTFAKKKELTDNAEEALKEAEELANKTKEQQALETRRSREQAAKGTLDRLKDKAGFILDIVGNDLVETFPDRSAEKPVDALSPEDQAFARFAFDALIPLAKKVRALESELQTANDDIVKYRGASPGGESGGSGGARGSKTGDDGAKETKPSTGIGSAVERIEASLAAAG